MTLIDVVNYSDVVYLIPMGDVHIGSKGVDYEKFEGYIDWVKKEKNAYIFFTGDIFDTATINSPTDTFSQTMNLNDAIAYFTKIVSPVKDRIVGVITGNHESRLEKLAGFNPLRAWADMNGIKYAGYSAVVRFRVGTHMVKKKQHPNVEYVFFIHHSTGGGVTIGGKLNRAQKLTSVFSGADAYICGHNHAKALGEEDIVVLDKNGRGEGFLKFQRVYYVSAGSFLKYEGYPEQKMLPPADTGAPRIRMDGTRKDLHISF